MFARLVVAVGGDVPAFALANLAAPPLWAGVKDVVQPGQAVLLCARADRRNGIAVRRRRRRRRVGVSGDGGLSSGGADRRRGQRHWKRSIISSHSNYRSDFFTFAFSSFTFWSKRIQEAPRSETLVAGLRYRF